MREKLKIGILLNDFSVPYWEYQIISQIKDSAFSQIVLVIKNNISGSHESEKKITGIANIITKLVEKADRFVFKTRVDFKSRKDLAHTFKSIRRVDLIPGDTSNVTKSKAADFSAIKDLDLDLILKFGCHRLEGEILKIAKYGIWTYSIDSCRDLNSPCMGFWEVVRKVPVTNSKLEILSSDNGDIDVIFNCWESTCAYSINISRDYLSWRSSLFAPRIMNGLYSYGEDYLNILKKRFTSAERGDEESLYPTSLSDSAGSLFRYSWIVAQRIIKKLLFTDAFRWQLLFKINDGKELYSSGYENFRILSSPREMFWADPFVVARDNRYYIFVEEFIYKKDRAHISVLKLDEQGNFLSSQKIIERSYHMSYPSVFEIDNTYYMIPETSKNRTIELYKCIEFPDKWEFERNIMENISAVDTTLFHYDNRWWLFTAVDQTTNISGCSTELFLFFADDVFSGKWESHPLNPVVSDIRRARPAGNLFIRDGKIFRPSQNCAGRYGIGFNINQVTKLTVNDYEETLITEVKPTWNKKLRGTHTLNFDNNFTVIDVYSFRSRFSI